MTLNTNTAVKIAADPLKSVEYRLDAIATLGNRRVKQAVPLLVRIVRSGPNTLSWTAAKSIIQIRSKRAVLLLMRVVGSNADLTSRQAATYALGRLRDPRATAALVPVLLDRTLPDAIRGEAAEALGECGSRKKHVLAALRAGTADSSVEVRFFATFALGLLCDQAAEEHLVRLLDDREVLPNYGTVAAEAQWALARIKSVSQSSGNGPDTVPT